MQEFAHSVTKDRPRWLEIDGLVIRLIVKRLRPAFGIDLNKLHETIHPCRCLIELRGARESDDDLVRARWISRPLI